MNCKKLYAGDALLKFDEFIQCFGLKRSFRYVNGYVDISPDKDSPLEEQNQVDSHVD
ncbi:hypothetical protein Q4490_06610 [Neptunomonas phycophila]|uniref:Uncharacterized protein n=2 Tax=Neptunomonas phycophila TaxID=1572645 RepID=A0AAW7XJJ9_9GAMM|nr:hypothetical protein [Neptunomonas phycophila]